jgi:hypothetical protein
MWQPFFSDFLDFPFYSLQIFYFFIFHPSKMLLIYNLDFPSIQNFHPNYFNPSNNQQGLAALKDFLRSLNGPNLITTHHHVKSHHLTSQCE